MIREDKKTLLCNFTAFFAVLTLGVMAGFFWTYTFNINAAVLHLEADQYAQMQSLFNVNVRHFMFFCFFFGAALCSGVAAVVSLCYRCWPRAMLQLLAGLVYLLGVVVLTKQVNLPLNAETESWVVGAVPAHWQQTRDAWIAANTWRTLASIAAFSLSVLALMVNPVTKR